MNHLLENYSKYYTFPSWNNFTLQQLCIFVKIYSQMLIGCWDILRILLFSIIIP